MGSATSGGTVCAKDVIVNFGVLEVLVAASPAKRQPNSLIAHALYEIDESLMHKLSRATRRREVLLWAKMNSEIMGELLSVLRALRRHSHVSRVPELQKLPLCRDQIGAGVTN